MSTGIGEALRDLGDAVDAIEASGWAVIDAEPTECDVHSDGSVELALRGRLPLVTDDVVTNLDLAVEGGSVDDEGRLEVDIVITRPVRDQAASSADVDEGADRGDGLTDVEAPGDVPVEASDDQATAPRTTSDVDESIPAYQDPERLRAVYEAHDSFPAMTEALGVDVTPQTVRRHMIEHGIHSPAAPADGEDPNDAEVGYEDPSETANGGDDEGEEDQPEEETGELAEREPGDGTDHGSTGGDGNGTGAQEHRRWTEHDTPATRPGEESVLPDSGGFDGVGIEELKDAVRTSRTIREVAQRLGVPRERAFRILNALDLIDLVSGRLESADRTLSGEEIDRRIERAVAAGE